jgi:hypothetical protein
MRADADSSSSNNTKFLARRDETQAEIDRMSMAA